MFSGCKCSIGLPVKQNLKIVVIIKVVISEYKHHHLSYGQLYVEFYGVICNVMLQAVFSDFLQ